MAKTGAARDRTGEMLRLMVVAVFFALALFNWLRDVTASRVGIPLTGIYTGTYDRKNVSSRTDTDTDAVLFYLIVAFTPPDGPPRQLPLLDHTDVEDWPETGGEIAVTWVPGEPGTLRRTDALRGVLGENAAWFLGIAALLLGAQLLDMRAKRAG